MELDYLPDFKGLVSVEFGPQTPIGGVGGSFPLLSLQEGLGGLK